MVATGVVVVLAVGRGFLGPSVTRVTPEQAKQAFARVGLRNPKVQSSPRGVLFTYGKSPHNVAVGVSTGAAPKLRFYGPTKDMRVTRWANVTIVYNKSETRAVRRAAKILGDKSFSSSRPQ